MDELELYKFQLREVEESLLADPSNEDLLKLKNDLEEMMSLYDELNSPKELAEEQPLKKAKVKSSSSSETVKRDNICVSAPSVSVSETYSADPSRQAADTDLISPKASEEWCIGALCEFFDTSSKAIAPGSVIGISADKTILTVRLSSTNKIKVVKAMDVSVPGRLKPSKKSETPETRTSPSSSIPTRSSPADGVSSSTAASSKKPGKSKSGYLAYVEKQEQKHAKKADTWRSFASSVSSRSHPSIFKAVPSRK